MRYWLVLVFICAFTSSGQAAEEARTWTSGKFTIEATFVRFVEEDGTEKVELDTGKKLVSILISKLSDTDQTYLESLRMQAAEDDVTDWEFDSARAQRAIDKFKAATAELEKKYRKESATLNQKRARDQKRLVRIATVALEKAADDEAKKSNAADAVRIRKAAALLNDKPLDSYAGRKENGEVNSDWNKQLEDLLGDWKWGARGMKDKVTIFRDGTATGSWGGKGIWEKKDSRVLILWTNNKTGYGSPKWDTINLPLDLENVTGDSWVGPNMLRAEKIRR